MKPEIEYVYNKLKRLRFDFNSSDFRDFRSYYRYEPELMRYVRKDDNDLFIAKEAFRPLEEELEYADKCHSLEEQLGCPLDVVVKALKYGIYTKYAKSLFGRCKLQKLNVCLVYSYGEYSLQPTHRADFSLYLEEYKKTWWLKKDKSE